MKTDIYQKVTDKIISVLEQGEVTWLKPWTAGNMEGHPAFFQAPAIDRRVGLRLVRMLEPGRPPFLALRARNLCSLP
ncbi:MAG: ArdC-like ssDNA-binding domain-containing protein [Pseudomonadota bacterium]